MRRALLLGIALLALGAAPAGAAPVPPTQAAGAGFAAAPPQSPPVQRERLAGADRFSTAAAISRHAYPGGSTAALLARADEFADALAASAYAGHAGAPLLLSGHASVPDATMAELRRLGASRVVLLGGTAALAPGVERRLDGEGFQVERVAGATRFATAAELARRIGPAGVGTVGGRRTAFLASGTSFPDALAAGPLAHAATVPVLLTGAAGLAPETAAAIRDLGIQHVVVLGGHAVIPSAVERQLGVPTTRLHGSDRTRTAAEIARFARASLGFGAGEVVLARGDAFPDALAAAGFAGGRRSPLLLSQGTGRLGHGARDHLLAGAGSVTRLTALGGAAALPGSVLDEADRAARGIAYAFPVRPPGAASYGRSHHDYPATDVFAACGTEAVSPTLGRVDEVSRTDTWDPAVNAGATRGGLSVSIVGDDGVRYYGSHFATIDAGVAPGMRVAPGQRLGTVGNTGSARPTPCHLHFGISPPCGRGDWEVRRGILYPWPYLDAWKAGDHASPAAAVAAWAAAHRGLCPGA